MSDASIDPAPSERELWLVELSIALDQALELVPELIMSGGRRPEAIKLYARIETAQAEIRSLRASGFRPRQPAFNPDRMQFAPRLIGQRCA